MLLLLLAAFALNGAALEAPQGSASDWNNRGSALFAASRYAEAELYFKKARELATANGPANPTELATIHINLAAVYCAQGRYHEAEPLYRTALEYSAEEPISPNSQSAVRGLALLYSEEGRLTEAEEFARRDLKLKVDANADALRIAEAENDLATILLARGKYAESEDLAQRAWTAVPKQDWHLHQLSGDALNTLGRISLAQEKNRSAEVYFSQAAQIFEGLLGADSPTVALVRGNLGKARDLCGDWQSAIELMTSSIAVLEKAYGHNNPKLAAGLSNLGMVYQERKRYRKANALFERALEIDSTVLGPRAIKTAADLNNLGVLASLQHHFRQSEPLLSRALSINELSLGETHPDTGVVAGNLARVYCSEKRYVDAEPLLKLALTIRERHYGADDPTLGVLLAQYTETLRGEHKFSEAETAEVRATRIQVRNALRAEPTQN